MGAEDRYRLAGRTVPARGAGGGGRSAGHTSCVGFSPPPPPRRAGRLLDPAVRVRASAGVGVWGPEAEAPRFFWGRGRVVVVEGAWPIGPAGSGSDRRWNVSCAPGWEWNLVYWGRGGREAVAFPGLWVGIIVCVCGVDARARDLLVCRHPFHLPLGDRSKLGLSLPPSLFLFAFSFPPSKIR